MTKVSNQILSCREIMSVNTACETMPYPLSLPANTVTTNRHWHCLHTLTLLTDTISAITHWHSQQTLTLPPHSDTTNRHCHCHHTLTLPTDTVTAVTHCHCLRHWHCHHTLTLPTDTVALHSRSIHNSSILRLQISLSIASSETHLLRSWTRKCLQSFLKARARACAWVQSIHFTSWLSTLTNLELWWEDKVYNDNWKQNKWIIPKVYNMNIYMLLTNVYFLFTIILNIYVRSTYKGFHYYWSYV